LGLTKFIIMGLPSGTGHFQVCRGKSQVRQILIYSLEQGAAENIDTFIISSRVCGTQGYAILLNHRINHLLVLAQGFGRDQNPWDFKLKSTPNPPSSGRTPQNPGGE